MFIEILRFVFLGAIAYKAKLRLAVSILIDCVNLALGRNAFRPAFGYVQLAVSD